MAKPESARISPTAHYTAYVWYHNGLSHPALATSTGKVLYRMLSALGLVLSRGKGSVNLEKSLRSRHAMIDHFLAEAIEDGRVTQVLELAAGLSGRGLRFMARYGDTGLTWVEGDLPDMAQDKRRRLEAAGLLKDGHTVVAVDLMADSGPLSLNAAIKPLIDVNKGVAIITEGFVPYFSKVDNGQIWARFSRLLAEHPYGVVFASLWFRSEVGSPNAFRIFNWLLGRFVRGQLHLDFEDEADVEQVLRASGLTLEQLHRERDYRERLSLPAGSDTGGVRILEARI